MIGGDERQARSGKLDPANLDVAFEVDVVQMQEIMKFQKIGVDELNRVKGQFRATGIRPRFLERIAELGYQLPGDIFDPARPVM